MTLNELREALANCDAPGDAPVILYLGWNAEEDAHLETVNVWDNKEGRAPYYCGGDSCLEYNESLVGKKVVVLADVCVDTTDNGDDDDDDDEEEEEEEEKTDDEETETPEDSGARCEDCPVKGVCGHSSIREDTEDL